MHFKDLLSSVFTVPCDELILNYLWRENFSNQILAKIVCDVCNLKSVEVGVYDEYHNYLYWRSLRDALIYDDSIRTRDSEVVPAIKESFIRFRYHTHLL